MASQTPNTPAGKPSAPSKKSAANAPLWGIKNPFIYAGTVVFLVVVIVAFVFFPTSVGSGGSGALSFGSYAGKPISYTQGSYMVSQVQALSEANPSTDNSEASSQIRNYQIYRRAFELTAVYEGILDEVASAGIVIPESILDERMAALPQFQENGAFSSRLYRQISSSQRLEMRRQLKSDFLSQSYTRTVYDVRPSKKESAFIGSMGLETRTVDYALYPLSAYPDSELVAWATANAKSFERLRLSRITAATEVEAGKLKKQVEGGSAFADLAKSKSTDGWASGGGDMGLRFRHELASDLADKADADKVASLAKGGLSAPLKTSSGSWAIYRLDDPPLAPVFTDPAVLADARNQILATERGKVEDWTVAKAKALADLPAKDFAANAKLAGAAVKTAGPFALDWDDLSLSFYGSTVPLLTPIPTAEAPELSGASRSEAFLTAAFSLGPGAVSPPLVLGENVLVLRIKEVGKKADDPLLPLYYSYFFQQMVDEEVRSSFLSSPKFKDRFMDVYLQYFVPKTAE